MKHRKFEACQKETLNASIFRPQDEQNGHDTNKGTFAKNEERKGNDGERGRGKWRQGGRKGDSALRAKGEERGGSI